jgi:trypsin
MNKVQNGGSAADPLQEQMDAAERLARLMVGEDDERFLLVFESLVNVMDGFRVSEGDAQRGHARGVLIQNAKPHLSRTRSALRTAPSPPPPSTAPGDSIYSDPVFLENARRMISNRERVVGGIPTLEYQDCVAIGSADQWCCTGTLIAENVVVTAGHCCERCSSRVFVGADVTKPEAGQEIEVAERYRHPDYSDNPMANDLTVLILAQRSDAPPRPLAKDGMLEEAGTVRLAGYGNTDVFSSGGYGIRRMVDVPLASDDPKYGADVAKEFVAGAPFLDRDSCNGDSGGPAYVHAEGGWYLVGATSRATASTVRPCGDGGIYTRVRAFEDWIRSIPGANWS